MDVLTLRSHRLVHLDLKGAPPRVSYFEKVCEYVKASQSRLHLPVIFPLLKKWGATGLLIEWEDTFPYTREIMQIGSNNPAGIASGYTTRDAHQILYWAGRCGLEVVPLVQTFGHLEFVLKHEEWRSLREVENFPSSICPSNPRTMSLIKSLIHQIVNFHRDIEYLHIGADEVWHLGLCPTCSNRANSSKNGKSALYLEHVLGIVQFIKDTYPNLKIIIWDDMLRSIELQVLNEYDIGKYVEPMIWHYNSRETFNLPRDLWSKYSAIFPHLWAASAFKGATGSSQQIPMISHHISNHERWLEELGTHGIKVPEFRGIAFTGWSRYDHYATMCELLPTAIPSLAMCIKVWLYGYSEQTHIEVAESLGYLDSRFLAINPQIRPIVMPHYGRYPGSQVTEGIESFLNLKIKYEHAINNEQITTWLNPWQVANDYTNPMQLKSLLTAFSELLSELSSVEGYLKVHMESVFFPAMIDEWMGTHLHPMRSRLSELKQTADNQIKLNSRS